MDAPEISHRLEIYDLYARYAHAVDNADPDAFAGCFTENGFTDVSSFGFVGAMRAAGATYVDLEGRILGRENLRLVATRNPESVRHHHCTLNVLIRDVTDSSARGDAYFVVFTPEDGRVLQYGRYEDTLTNVEGRWLFAARRDIALFVGGTTLR